MVLVLAYVLCWLNGRNQTKVEWLDACRRRDEADAVALASLRRAVKAEADVVRLTSWLGRICGARVNEATVRVWAQAALDGRLVKEYPWPAVEGDPWPEGKE